MADISPPPNYNRGRRGSLPAMKLNVPLLAQTSLSSPRHSRRKVPLHESVIEESRTRSGSWSESDKKKMNSTRRGSITELPTRTNRDSSPAISKHKNNQLSKSHSRKSSSKENSPSASPRSNADDDDSDSDEAFAAKAAAYKNRGRRHSVDVLVMPKDKRLLPSKTDKTQKAWAEICRVSDPKFFDADEYEKDHIPSGSSLFQAVLGDLKEDEDEGTDTNPSKPKHHQQQKRGTHKKVSSKHCTEAVPKPRQVRFHDKIA